jgi:hypothetical protein
LQREEQIVGEAAAVRFEPAGSGAPFAAAIRLSIRRTAARKSAVGPAIWTLR